MEIAHQIKLTQDILALAGREAVEWLRCESALRIVAAPTRSVDAVVSFGPSGVSVEVTAPPRLEVNPGASTEDAERANWIMHSLEQRGITLHRVLSVLARELSVDLESETQHPPRRMSSLDLSSATGFQAGTIRRLALATRISTPRGELALADLVRLESKLETTVVFIDHADGGRRLVWVRADDGRRYLVDDARSVPVAIGERLVLTEPMPAAIAEFVAGAFMLCDDD